MFDVYSSMGIRDTHTVKLGDNEKHNYSKIFKSMAFQSLFLFLVDFGVTPYTSLYALMKCDTFS